MTDKIWQCCFTNTDHVNGSPVKSGWTPLAVSASIPHLAYEACIKWQAANSRIENESSTSLNSVYELICDSGYAFAMQHKYGLKDNYGRPNMFSHAYIVPIEEFLKDPNCLLALSDVNFVDSQEEAEKRNNAESSLSNPVYDKSLEISSSLESLSMDREAYKSLLRTVYVLNADERNLRPLHIEAYEDRQKIKALIYLIHKGLPYHTRENLKIAIMPQTDTYFRNILFDKDAKSRGIYIVPESGESNNRAQASPVCEIIDEFAEHFDREEKESYYKELSDKATGLGGTGALTERALKVAYAMNNIGDVKEKSEWSDEKLMLRLSDAFLYNADMISGLEYRKSFEDFVAVMLEEVMKRRLGINENMYERISAFSIRATSDNLKEVWKELRQYQFETAMSEEQKRAWFINLETNALESFIAFSSELINQKRDNRALREYLVSAIEKSGNLEELLKTEAKILRIEIGVLDKASKEDFFKDIHKLLTDRLWKLYKSELESTDIKKTYKLFVEAHELLSSLDENFSKEEAKVMAKNYFWENFSFEKLEKIGMNDELHSLMDLPADANCKKYTDFIDILNKMPEQRDIYESLKELNIYYIQNIEGFAKEEDYREKILMKNIFTRFFEKNIKRNTGEEFEEGFVEDMVKIATEVSTYAIYDEFIYIMKNISGLKSRDYESLDELSFEIEDGELKTNNILRRSMFNRIYEKFKAMEIDEDGDNVIKLDSWLALGKIYYSNLPEQWFEVFDDKDYKAKVLLDKNIEDLLEDSYYFIKCENEIERADCLNSAIYYVDNKGQHRSVIHKWVKYIERLDKEPSGGIGDFFGKLFAKKKED